MRLLRIMERTETLTASEAVEILRGYVGKDLLDLAINEGITIRKNGNLNKGWSGRMIEVLLDLPLDNSRRPDLGDCELKSIPVKRLIRTGVLAFKETMSITTINYDQIKDVLFEDSYLLNKMKSMVIVTRLVGAGPLPDSNIIHSITEVKLEGVLYKQVKEDYESIQQVIRNNGQLRSRMGIYIQPRTKGSGHGSISRGFYARKKFLREIINLED